MSITPERMARIRAHAKRHEDEGFPDNDVTVLLDERAKVEAEHVARYAKAIEVLRRAADRIDATDEGGDIEAAIDVLLREHDARAKEAT